MKPDCHGSFLESSFGAISLGGSLRKRRKHLPRPFNAKTQYRLLRSRNHSVAGKTKRDEIDKKEPVLIQPDPTLTGTTAAIEQSLIRNAQSLEPEQFSTLIGAPGLSVMRSAMDALQADSLSVWLADRDQSHLVVTHSEPNTDFVGYQQTLEEGLIALVYASEQCLCENEVYQNAQHSKAVDEALGQVTYAMIATPFYIAGNLKGVISCVQLKEDLDAPNPDGFSARNMNRVRRLSTAIERLVNYRILTTLLDLEL